MFVSFNSLVEFLICNTQNRNNGIVETKRANK